MSPGNPSLHSPIPDPHSPRAGTSKCDDHFTDTTNQDCSIRTSFFFCFNMYVIAQRSIHYILEANILLPPNAFV